MITLQGRFLQLFGPIAILICIVYLGFEQTQLNKYKAEALSEVTNSVTLAAGRLKRDLELLRSDVNVVASSEALRRYLVEGTPTTDEHIYGSSPELGRAGWFRCWRSLDPFSFPAAVHENGGTSNPMGSAQAS